MSVTFQTNDGMVHLACPGYIYSDTITSATDDDLKHFAQAYDLIAMRPTGAHGREQLLKDNGAVLVCYAKANASSKDAWPEAYYSHKKGGARKADSTWNINVMQPDSSGWIDAHLKELKSLPAWSQGFYLDSAGSYSYYQGGVPATPNAFTNIYTLSQWYNMLNNNLRYWKTETAPSLFTINGLSTDVQSLYPPCVAQIENAFGSDSGVLPTQDQWLATAQLLMSSQRQGWTPWPFVKMHTTDQTVWTRFRRLCVPTVLLCDLGSILFELGGNENTTPPWRSLEYTHDLYNTSIGPPTETFTYVSDYLKPNGLYVRHFTKGIVLVNPTSKTIFHTTGDVPAHQGAVRLT